MPSTSLSWQTKSAYSPSPVTHSQVPTHAYSSPKTQIQSNKSLYHHMHTNTHCHSKVIEYAIQSVPHQLVHKRKAYIDYFEQEEQEISEQSGCNLPKESQSQFYRPGGNYYAMENVKKYSQKLPQKVVQRGLKMMREAFDLMTMIQGGGKIKTQTAKKLPTFNPSQNYTLSMSKVQNEQIQKQKQIQTTRMSTPFVFTTASSSSLIKKSQRKIQPLISSQSFNNFKVSQSIIRPVVNKKLNSVLVNKLMLVEGGGVELLQNYAWHVNKISKNKQQENVQETNY